MNATDTFIDRTREANFKQITESYYPRKDHTMNAAKVVDPTANNCTAEILQQYMQNPKTQLFTEVETLSMLNKERNALDARYTALRDSIIKQMKALKTKKVKTPANVTATLFTQLRTTLDMVIVAQLLTPKQIKKASKRSKVTTLKVTP